MSDAWIVPAGLRRPTCGPVHHPRRRVGTAPFDSLNLGTHVGDDPGHGRRQPGPPALAARRAVLAQSGAWHDRRRSRHHGGVPDADAAVSRRPGAVCVVMTADCLPVLLCDRAGTVVGAAHAGWRGLQGG